jgi:hypothetical protein
MEYIKKKICLEPFISRIPATIATIDNEDIVNNENGSWGRIPKTIVLWGKEIKYQTLMNLYYSVLKVITSAKYYEYDAIGEKWLISDLDWRDTFQTYPVINYYNVLPEVNLTDRLTVGITSDENLTIFYDYIKEVSDGYYDGFSFITAVNEIIGRIIVPYAYKCEECGHIEYNSNLKKCKECDGTQLTTFQEVFVPYFIYYKEIPKWIALLQGLKTDICCEKKKYEEYGGDAFLKYLQQIQENDWPIYKANTDVQPTIDIPLLLTSSILDLGQYRTYDVDVVSEDGEIIDASSKASIKPKIIKTQAESKLQSLRRRKNSVDDNGEVLPFILTVDTVDDKKSYSAELPYQVNYVKNLSINGNSLYGDTIVEIKETCTPKEVTESIYLSYISNLRKDEYIIGLTNKPLAGLNRIDVLKNIQFGDKGKYSLDDVERFYESDLNEKRVQLASKMKSILSTKYPKVLCLKQDFTFNYTLTYGVEDIENAYEDETGNIITPIKAVTLEKTHSDSIYVVYDNPIMEFTYVTGGRFRTVSTKNSETKEVSLNEKNPFTLAESLTSTWNGEGIWYRETYPIKKKCTSQFLIDGVMREFTYDVINFDGKKRTYTFPGIDFKRKNYILCEEVMYNSDAYYKNATNDKIFKDEKMLGLNYPLKETYDVAIERGTSAAYEKHIQLTDIKTWQDLEDYRNGMFLNK